MKKILYIATLSSTINAFLVPHINHLISKGHKVDIATNIKFDINQELISRGVNIFNIPFQRNPLSPKNKDAYKIIKKLQKEERYNIIHVHTPVASFITRLALKNNKNLKLVYTCHGFHFYNGGSILNWIIFYPLEKIAAKWTDKLITINTEDYEIATKFKLRNNGKVIKMHGVGIEKEKYAIENFDKSKYRKKLGLNDEDFVILVLAEINKNKNHIQIIKAIDLLRDQYNNIKAIFAGKGPLEEHIMNEIKNRGLEEQIKLLGWRDDVKELINSSDVVGLFSKREGLGKCLLEAMICEKCVIATNTRGPREIIENRFNGFIFEVDDVYNTAESIKQIYTNNELKYMFEKRSLDKIQKYSLENVLQELDYIYEDL